MSSKQPHITIVSVPSEAGAHWGGQAQAPATFHNQGLAPKLSTSGYAISSISALSLPELYTAQPLVNGVRNEERVLEVMKSVNATILSVLASTPDTIPLIIGGDCSITPAILSAICNGPGNAEKKIGLLYFDGDVDLSIPRTSEGTQDSDASVFDSMVLSHLTQREGCLESMRTFSRMNGDGNAAPLVNKDNIVLFGFDPAELKLLHWLYLLENGYKAFGAPTVRKDPVETARKAMEWLEERCDKVFVHFDVDAISSAMFPLGNFPHYNGLTFEEAMAALEVFVKSEKLVGLVVTEVNPNNDGSGNMVGELVDGVVEAFRLRINH